MPTDLQLYRIIGQLTEENASLLESYAEYLLFRQKGKQIPVLKKSNATEFGQTSDRLKTVRKFKGKAKYPDTPTNKYEVYEQ